MQFIKDALLFLGAGLICIGTLLLAVLGFMVTVLLPITLMFSPFLALGYLIYKLAASI